MKLHAAVPKDEAPMTANARALLLAAALVAAPLAGALAQSSPTGNYGTNQSTSASPGTVDNKATSGLNAASSQHKPSTTTAAAANKNVPGATGRTIVPGSSSTIAGDAPNTASAKTDGGGTSGAGGGGGGGGR